MSKTKDILHIYTRVSTVNQEKDGTSLDSQLKLGKQKAKSLGMDLEHHNEKSASSSKKDLENRPIIKELLARVSEGEIKNIYVYSIDRLSRNTTTSTIIRETLRKSKCILYTNTNETNLDSLEQNLLYGIISEISQYENMLRKERLNYGKRVKARQGYWMGGPTPFGYKINKNKKLTLDKEQSEWVKRMFKWYSQGLSPKRIKHKLDGSVLTKRGNPIWSYGSVEAILRNTHPNGSYVYYEKEIPCPRIVEPEIWEKVQKRLSNKKRMERGKNIKNYNFPLREIMYCGHCGTQMGGRTHRLICGETRTRYKCVLHNKKWKETSTDGDWKRNKYCENNASMESSPTEDSIWTTLLGVLELSHQQRETFKRTVLSKKNRSQESKEKGIEKLNIKIDKTKDSISRIEEGIEKKEIEKISSREKAKSIQSFIDKLHIELHRLSIELIELENELVVLENDNLWIDWIDDYKSNLNKLNNLKREERIDQIKTYIKKIDVFFNKETRKHRLNLHFKLPLIEDHLKWKESLKRKKGYVISKGETEKVLYLERGGQTMTKKHGSNEENQIVLQT